MLILETDPGPDRTKSSSEYACLVCLVIGNIFAV